MTECRRVYRPSTASIVVAELLGLSVVENVQPVHRKESGFEVARLNAEAIQSRTVVAAAEESSSPELGAASEFVRMMERTVVVVGEIGALELVAGFESAYALDSQLRSEIELVELSDEHLVLVGPADAETRHSESL